MDIKKGRGYVYHIQYHIVWCVKYRQPILKNEIDYYLKKVLLNIAKNHKFSIIEIESDYDHIHLLIECSPQHYIPNIIKALKGISARYLLKEFPEIKEYLYAGHIWNPSYFVATVSDHTDEQIRQYIINQKVRK